LDVLEHEVDMPVDEQDLIYSLAAQVYHLSNDEDKRNTLQRIEEDFPTLYPEVKRRLVELSEPESLPPGRSSGSGGPPDSKVTKAIQTFDHFASTLRKHGVWGAIAALLFACSFMAWQLTEARRQQQELLEEMIRIRTNHMEQNIVIEEGARVERGAIMKGGAPSQPAQR
jgi:hypothetical protein